MHRYLLFLLTFLLFTSILCAQNNHLNIIASMQGAHNDSYFGYSMATLDFNHDGFDDLVVCSPEWKTIYPDPMNWPKGKVDIYFGGPNFDNSPDITMEGQYDFQYMGVYNIGDINGDGFDDLRISGHEQDPNQNEHNLRIYTGGNTAPLEPNIMIPYTLETNYYIAKVTKLGDINGDNHDDIGFSIGTPNSAEMFYIVWGSSLEREYITTSSNYSDSYTVGFNGIGDINNDGYEDFTIGYTNEDPNTGYHLITIYYGNAESSLTDTMVLTRTQSAISKISTPLGDINGDGIDDFMGYQSITGLNVWLGSTETDTIPNFALTPAWQGGEFGQSLKYGDLNNDGFDDVAGANYYQNQFRIWMGYTQVNGISDLLITAPYIPENPLDYFGYGLTMGDYNGDNCCDIAVSAPFTDNTLLPDYRGYVYIYAGNPDLDDPTPISDETETPAISKLQLYPNPLQPSQSNLNVQFSTPRLTPDPSLARKRGEINPLSPSGREGNSTFDIYNIKGQKVKSFAVSAELLKSGSASFNLNDLSSGVYVCVFSYGNMQHKGKITVIR